MKIQLKPQQATQSIAAPRPPQLPDYISSKRLQSPTTQQKPTLVSLNIDLPSIDLLKKDPD